MIRFLSLAIALILTTIPVEADERDIKSSGGAFMGKYKFRDIDATDALLGIELAGRRMVGIKAGYIGNNSYREHWNFNNSYLTYDKLTSGSHFVGGAFTESGGLKYICGPGFKQKCEIIKSDKVSKNLIIVTYRRIQGGSLCAGLIYVDEEIYGEGYEGSYGDYNVRSVSCVLAGGDVDEAVALSAHYLSLVKKDGRRIANLARYDFPKPKSLDSRQSGTSAVSSAPSALDLAQKNRCHLATSPYLKWEEGEKYREDIEEAKKLGLRPDCREQLGLHYVRASQPASQSSAQQQTSTRPGDGEESVQFPMAYKWQGVTDLASGTLTTSTKGSEGGLSLNLRANIGNCTGKWERKGGKPNTVADSYGVWYMRCDNGLASSGSYEMTGRRHGKGEGKDSNGRDVTFTFGQ